MRLSEAAPVPRVVKQSHMTGVTFQDLCDGTALTERIHSVWFFILFFITDENASASDVGHAKNAKPIMRDCALC